MCVRFGRREERHPKASAGAACAKIDQLDERLKKGECRLIFNFSLGVESSKGRDSVR
jgi:hypothetical protein